MVAEGERVVDCRGQRVTEMLIDNLKDAFYLGGDVHQ